MVCYYFVSLLKWDCVRGNKAPVLMFQNPGHLIHGSKGAEKCHIKSGQRIHIKILIRELAARGTLRYKGKRLGVSLLLQFYLWRAEPGRALQGLWNFSLEILIFPSRFKCGIKWKVGKTQNRKKDYCAV